MLHYKYRKSSWLLRFKNSFITVTKIVYFILSEPENTYREAVKVFSGSHSIIVCKDLFSFIDYEWLNMSISTILSRL